MTKTKKRLLWLFSILVAGFLVILAAILLTGAPHPPAVTASERDGYMKRIAAAELVKGKAPDFKTAGQDEIRAFVEANQEALSLLRLTLKLECRVPVDYSLKYAKVQPQRHQAIRQMARLLMAEGRLAEAEQRVADAVHSNLDLIQLGQNTTRGGLFLDFLVGMGFLKNPG